MKKIISCDLPLPIQRLYIKRLKHMIWRWEHENFCGHCPVNKGFKENFPVIRKMEEYDYSYQLCHFCLHNVSLKYGCPCTRLKPKQALKRAKDFIERFEAGDGGMNERTQ